ncbi:MAG TPA: SDR family NAD(P)-dependent oxidoreductase [Dehalococcoidia bacterium]|nr:SDR family NAD(P)-dependent oxidoreductase [Dehalococcoidia bacterium]
MDLGIKGRVALVTGAGRGIGRQICLTLAEEGAAVAVNDVIQERADAVANDIIAAGGRALGQVADVTDLDAVRAMLGRVANQLGPVDILVNNAGIPVITSSQDAQVAAGQYFSQSERAQWDRTMGLITYGVLNCSRAVVEQMAERRWGRIISIISDAGRVGEPRLVAYSMAKAGVVGFSKALAKEVGRYCITVNCVSPATTATEATAAWLQAQGEQIMRSYPMAKGLNRLGKPSDIADAVAFLASARAEWITGQVLSVNGGYSMPD